MVSTLCHRECESWCQIIQKMPNGGAMMEMNIDTLVEYNGVSSIGDEGSSPLTQGVLTGNVQGDPRQYLRDIDNQDFRPKCGSNLYTANPPTIVGAYNFSTPNTYWIPGRQTILPSSPVPAHGATGVMLDADLMWLHSLCGTTHRVYWSSIYAQV